jgi:hypothetical protein
MPIYIEEIVFHGEVTGIEPDARDSGPAAAGAENAPARRREDREALIDAAVAEVIRRLRRERER